MADRLSYSEQTRRNFAVVLVAVVVLVVVGMIGYSVIEGWRWLDALYFTIITFSTVGFQEVRPLDANGRIFTMFMIFLSLIVLAMLSASVTSFLVRQELIENLKAKKMRKMIKSLRGHTILCGAGDTGRTVIDEFMHAQKKIVVIEEHAEVIEKLMDVYPKILVVQGDATKDDVLSSAGIENASGLITALSEDTSNLYVVISARALNKHLTIVARAIHSHAATKMYKAGATHVISPNLTEGRRMAATVLRPSVVSFLDVMMHDQEMDLRLEEVRVSENSSFAGKSLRQLELPQKTGLIVIAIVKQQGGKADFHYNPQSSAVVQGGDSLIVLGDAARVRNLEKLIQEAAA